MTAIVVFVRPASRLLAAVPRRRRPVHRAQEPPAGRVPTTPDVWLAGLRLGG
ncbi:hypothetical protein [Streptomyces sp. NPDC001312]|uniref:hypothetical protein n=1 Tax=Streptomyces sp. NPDC001312 TaxID=3364561 RepID=UPI00368D6744